MKNTISSSLQNLGLSDKEAAVYAALLGLKRGTAATVSSSAGIKRPTAYLVLESLKKKKLVASTKFRGVMDYRALPLEHLKHHIHAQKRLADVALPTIQKLYNDRKNKVRLRVYHTIADVKTLLEKSLREKSVLYILGPHSQLINELGEYWHFFTKRCQQQGTPPQFKNFPGSIALLLWSDKAAFVELTEKVQVFGFKNKALHDMYFDWYQKV